MVASSEIRILHVNDFHGFAEPYKPFGSDEMTGGIAYLAGRLDHFAKKRHPYCFRQGT